MKKIVDHIETEDFFGFIPCGCLAVDSKGKIMAANSTLLSLLGYEDSEVSGVKRFQDLLSIGGKLYYETHYMPLLLHQKKVKEINFEMVTKSRKRIPTLVNTVIRTGKQGEQVFLSTVFDITQRKMYEKELFAAKEDAEQLNKKLTAAYKELEQFAYVVSHDIKSPLNAIFGLVKLFEKNYLSMPKEKAIKYLSTIKSSSQRLSEIVDGILNYYTNSDLTQSEPELIASHELIQKVLSIADPNSEARLTVVGEPTTIRSHRTPVQLILLNLLVNAIKYNDKEQIEIEVAISSQTDLHTFRVTDNGCGIREADLEKIFTPLRTLGLKDRYNQQGTGLGLSYVKRMVEKLGGTIEVESELGQGSTFLFTIKEESAY